jgi:hypothetical protein
MKVVPVSSLLGKRKTVCSLDGLPRMSNAGVLHPGKGGRRYSYNIGEGIESSIGRGTLAVLHPW